MSSPDHSSDEKFEKLFKQYHASMDSRDIDAATDAIHDIFALAERWAEDAPSPAYELEVQAGRCEEMGDWAGAEAAYRAILLLPAADSMNAYRAHDDLVGLYCLLDRWRDASAAASRATAEARRADFPTLLAIALATEASTLIYDRRFDEARPLLAEGLSIVSADQELRQIYAKCLALRARCAIHDGDLVSAQSDLHQAFELLEPLSELEIAAGAHLDLARCWSAQGILRTAQQNHAGAVLAWQQAVARARHVASLPQAERVWEVAVARMLAGLADAYSAAGRDADAENATKERTAILKRRRIA